MTSLSAATSAIESRERALHRRIGEAKAVAGELRAAKAALTEAEELQTACTEAAALLRAYTAERQAGVLTQLEKVATAGLRNIFPAEDLRLRLQPSAKGKTPSLSVQIVSGEGDTEVVTSALDARGGGVVAVVGFLLRLVVVLLQPGTRKILALDETFSFVSAEYEERMVAFIAELVHRSGVQAIVVTHHSREAWLEAADVAYEFSLTEGRTSVRTLKTADLAG